MRPLGRVGPKADHKAPACVPQGVPYLWPRPLSVLVRVYPHIGRQQRHKRHVGYLKKVFFGCNIRDFFFQSSFIYMRQYLFIFFVFKNISMSFPIFRISTLKDHLFTSSYIYMTECLQILIQSCRRAISRVRSRSFINWKTDSKVN